jgi:hypothetical protein
MTLKKNNILLKSWTTNNSKLSLAIEHPEMAGRLKTSIE